MPLLILIVLYHEVMLVLFAGFLTFLVNAVSIVFRYFDGSINIHNSREIEIQIAVILLCFIGSVLASRLYDEIHHKNIQASESMQKMTMQTVQTIANTIDAKDEYTQGHSKRVSDYSGSIARELGFSPKQIGYQVYSTAS